MSRSDSSHRSSFPNLFGRVPPGSRLRRLLALALLWVMAGCVQQSEDLYDRDDDGVTAEIDCDDQDPGVGVGYADGDGDSFGAPDPLPGCNSPSGAPVVSEGNDCDDTRRNTHPGADEVCDEIDNDCDGEVDEGPVDPSTWFQDLDSDSFGDPDQAEVACAGPVDSILAGGDCDDTRADVNPDAGEVCDSADNDCDDAVDENAIDSATWYPDADADTYGDAAGAMSACESPAQYVARPGDCDDQNAATYPGALEVCDGIDSDCDGDTDSAWLLPEGELGYRVVKDAIGDQTGTESDPYASVRAALNATRVGCPAVRVEQGRYLENLIFPSHDVHLYAVEGELPVLDGSGAAPVMIINGGSSPETRVEGFVIEDGWASGGGGIVIYASSPTLRRLVIQKNLASENGGGLWIQNASPRFEDCEISDNEAWLGGGGAYIYAASPAFANCVFEHNVADGLGEVSGGGALLVFGGSRPTLENCRMTDNMSGAGASGGGAIHLAGNGSTCPVLSNVLIANNFTEGYGGGIYQWDSCITLEHTVIANNSSYYSGGGVAIFNVTAPYDQYLPTLLNTIVAYNSNYNIAALVSVTLDATGSDHYAAAGNSLMNVAWPDGNYSAEPGFLAYELSDGTPCLAGSSASCLPVDFHLALDSALVDGGDPGSPPDVDGSPADPGIYGGPEGGSWDLDWDDYPDYFWPGECRDAPAGIDAEDFDSDDGNESVHKCVEDTSNTVDAQEL